MVDIEALFAYGERVTFTRNKVGYAVSFGWGTDYVDKTLDGAVKKAKKAKEAALVKKKATYEKKLADINKALG